jgi:Putative zinc-finger
MEKIPQIVRERLKAGAAGGGHPDANVLTAFAERLLPDAERAGVFAHLAACDDCREIVALALPAPENVGAASSAVRRNWATWPVFRRGFAAAGVALIVVGAVQFERRQSEHSEAVARQVAPAPVSANVKDESPSQTASAVPAATPHPALIANEKLAKKDRRKLPPGESRLMERDKLQRQGIARIDASPAAAAAKQTSANAPPPPAVSQTVEVQTQNQALETENADSAVAQAPSANHAAEQLFGYNAGPLSRAKAADVQPAPARAAGAALAAARWSITPVGGLQRSLDQGKTWQDVDVNASSVGSGVPALGGPVNAVAKQNSMHGAMLKAVATPVFFRAVTAAGSEVWAGGSNAALFHSIDRGDHWTRVLPSYSGVVLTGDVLGVEFPDPQHGSVTTSTPESWVTSDGGQSWQKQ